MMEALPYGGGLTVGLAPVDLSGAAQDAAWVNVRDINNKLVIVFMSGVGTAGEDPVLSLQQAKDAAGLDAVTLGIKRAFYKVGAPAFNASNDKFVEDTAVTAESPATSYSTALYDGAENQVCVVLMVRPIDLLDGYSFVRLRIADVGVGAQLGYVLYMPSNSAYGGRTVPSILG